LPELAEQNIIKKGGKLWLPNLDCVQCSIDDFHNEISRYYSWETRDDPKENPLYAATETVTDELIRCPDMLTNETQIRPLLVNSSAPFLVLTRREIPLDIAVLTPSKKGLNYSMSPRRNLMPVPINEEGASPMKRRAASKSPGRSPKKVVAVISPKKIVAGTSPKKSVISPKKSPKATPIEKTMAVRKSPRASPCVRQ
jgi:hypothetical protein